MFWGGLVYLGGLESREVFVDSFISFKSLRLNTVYQLITNVKSAICCIVFNRGCSELVSNLI